MVKRIVSVLAVLIGLALLGLYAAGAGWLGSWWGAGEVTPVARPADVVDARVVAQRNAAATVGAEGAKQVLFGDFHVHSTFSVDAFLMSLPLTGGEGAHPVSDACDFARFCSALDFWSINDHALALTPRAWSETIESVRQCDAVAGDASNPDVTPFLGWEWTQMGTRPENHYGHKNVVLRGLGEEAIPSRPIAAATPPDAAERDPEALAPSPFALGLIPLVERDAVYLDMNRYLSELVSVPICPADVPVRDLPADCREEAVTPGELFAKLDDWGFDSVVIPHGTTWGMYTPQGSTWDKQLSAADHDPQRQTLVEVFSGHGNSEEYRPWRSVVFDADGGRSCPRPSADFTPSCWRAGEIIRGRCAGDGESDAECEERAARARQLYVEGDIGGHLAVPGVGTEEWLDSGQCRDCFQPSFNYRPGGSVQYMMALRNFEKGSPERFRFGFMASSDNHSSRPGTGYKEYARFEMTEARLGALGETILGGRDSRAASSEPELPDPGELPLGFFGMNEAERATSFFLTGGLIAVHAEGRDREAIWGALDRRETYGTSGPRILLWFDLLNPPGSRGAAMPMGGSVEMRSDPIFRVRAVGSLEQEPGCPDHVQQAVNAEHLARLCKGECYNPSDRRRPITRIEVVRIRPQMTPGEPVAGLIEDPWQVFHCDGDPAGCTVHFSDAEFGEGGRDALYYARAIEAPSLAVNADNLRCERAADGSCLRTRACRDVPPSDDCLAETEERAWSSPIFVDFTLRSEDAPGLVAAR